MKRKIISFCTAVIMTAMCMPSASAATIKDIISALPKYESDYKNVALDVDADIELRLNGSGSEYADNAIEPESITVPADNPTVEVDYKATLYMEAVREEFLRYWNTAQLLCAGDDDLLTQLDNMPVSGDFTVKIKYPETMSVPNDMVTTTGEMYGFNDEAKYVFKDVERKVETDSNTLVISIKVKDPDDSSKEYVLGKALYDNLDTYLADLTLTCEGVSVTGIGKHSIFGEVTGQTIIGDSEILAQINGNPIQSDPSAEPDAISTVTYTAVQIQTEDHPLDQEKDSIYENVVLATATPTPTPSPTPSPTSRPGYEGGSSGTGLIAGGGSSAHNSTPVPVSTIVPSEPATSAALDRDNHYAYIIGYPEGDVRPEGNITRAEVATIFFRMLTDESRKALWSTDNDYSDVVTSDWFNNAVSTMTAAGVVNGYDDGTFKPNASITRAEFAAIIARFIGGTYTGWDKFSDIAGHWAAEYINRAAHYGWIHGYENGTYRPDNKITRAEAMTLVNNVLDRHVEESGLLDDMVKWPDNTSDMWYYTAVQEATNSHHYESGEPAETWTAIREPRDWAALETELSNADSAGAEESIIEDLNAEDAVNNETVVEETVDEDTSSEETDEVEAPAEDTTTGETTESDTTEEDTATEETADDAADETVADDASADSE